MSRRHEDGQLGNPETQQDAHRVAKLARRQIKSDLLTLERMPEFLRWLGRLAVRSGYFVDIATTNGGDLQKFMGRRSIFIEVRDELEVAAPGFYRRVLDARAAFEKELTPTSGSEESTDAD